MEFVGLKEWVLGCMVDFKVNVKNGICSGGKIKYWVRWGFGGSFNLRN